MIMETKKSHKLLSASWESRKTDGIIQSKSKGLRSRETDNVSLRSSSKVLELAVQMSEHRNGCLGLSTKQIPLLLPFVLGWPSRDGMIPTWTGEDLLYPVYQFMTVNSNMSRNNVSPAIWSSLSHVDTKN